MKKMLVLVGVGLLMVGVMNVSAELKGTASTPGGYGAAGCGLGSLVFGNQPGFVQVFAATTNGTFGSQTFGITTGTSNCEKQPKFASNERLNEFVKENLDNLAKDIARGYGESLDTLSELLGVSSEERDAFYSKLQSNFSTIFPSENVETADVVDSIIVLIQG
jgi:hypothetical protein